MNDTTRRVYSQEDIEFIQTYYPTQGGKYCAEQLGRTLSSIHNIARQYNIKVKIECLPYIFQEVYKKSNDKFNVNADLFIIPVDPYVIYTMGLLWADGTLNGQKNYLREITLKSTYPDGDEFYKIMSSFGKWNYYKYDVISPKYKKLKPSIQIKTNNRPLFDYLMTIGYKTKSIDSADKVLNTIPKNLRNYWFRGLFDGDGSLYVKNRTIQIVLSGPFEQEWIYLTDLLKNLGVSYSKNKICNVKGHKSSYIRFTGAINCKKFLDYIYEHADEDKIYLSRKYKKYLLI